VMVNDYDIDDLPLPLIAELMEDVSHGTLEFMETGDFTYQPDPNYDEWDSFSYRVFDGVDYSETVNADLLMSSINDAPTIELPESFTISEDSFLEVDFSLYIDDVDGDTMDLTFTEPDNFSAIQEGLFIYFEPDENWHGSETLTFTVDDQQSRDTATDEMTIIVTPVNDDPVAEAGGPYEGIMYLPETCEITLDGSGSYDPDDDIVQWLWSWESNEVSGEIVTGEFYQGSTEVMLTVTDSEGASHYDLVEVFIIEYQNIAPVAIADEYYLWEDSEVTDNVMVNDYDIDDLPLPLIAELMEDVSHGTLEFMETGDFTYQPDPNYDEWDSFSYRVFDGVDYSETVNADLLMSSINDAPTIELPESFTISEDSFLEVDFSLYIDDVDGDTMDLTFTEPDNFSAIQEGLFIYFEPDENWHGSETLTFTVDDQQSRDTASDEMTIIVTSVNDDPVAEAGGPYEGIMYLPETCEITLDGSGSYDPDDDIVQWLWSWESNEVSGEIVTGEFYQGSTEVMLTVTDSEGASHYDMAEVFIIEYQNIAPVAIADEYYPWEDGEVTDNVMVNDYDYDDLPLPLVAELVDNVTHGTLEFMETGDFTYQPDPDYDEWDSFSYRVFDGVDYSETVNADLLMSSINDAPTIDLPDNFTFAEDGILEVYFASYVNDVDNVDLVLSVTGGSNITIDIYGLNVTFTASDNWFGSETLTFTIDDQQERVTASDEVEIIVTASGLTVISKEIIPGWNWFSLNVTADDMSADTVLASLGDAGNSIKSQTQSSIYYDGLGWFGSLNECDNFTFYKLDADSSAIWEFAGSPVDVGENVYNLASGWNWISYAPQIAEDINFALAQLVDNGSNIKSQTQSSINYENIGWYGSLSTLQPLGGYMLQMDADQEFIYPLPAVRQQSFYSRQSAETYDDCNPHAYEYNAVLIASSDQPIAEDSRLIACCEGETRSICQILDYTSQFGRKFYSLMLYSNELNEADFQLYYQESADRKIIEVSQKFTFLVDMTMGDFINPVIIDLNYSDNEDVLKPQKMITVYPNPFNPETNIHFELAEPGTALIEIYNVKGQKLETLLNCELSAGKHLLTWNPQNQSSGIYLLNFQTADTKLIRKLILLK